MRRSPDSPEHPSRAPSAARADRQRGPLRSGLGVALLGLTGVLLVQVAIFARSAPAAPATETGTGPSSPASIPQSTPRTPRPVTLEREAWLMGTRLHAMVEAPEREWGLAATEAAFDEVRRLEGLLSTWDDRAEMARLNRGPAGHSLAVSHELFQLLERAEEWAERTGRAFEPAIGPLVDAWDLRGEGRRPTEDELAVALAAVRGGIELLPRQGALRRRHARAWLDTGGFGKGAALNAAGVALRAAGIERAILDFGGQALAIGTREGADGWRLGVAHPRDRASSVAVLLVRDVSVATSGNSERFVAVDGKRLGHLIDPRSGHPVPDWGSVTVVTADPLAADALSTALYIMGPVAGLRWARDREDVGVLFLEDAPTGLRAHWNGAMERWLRSVPSGGPEVPERRGENLNHERETPR